MSSPNFVRAVALLTVLSVVIFTFVAMVRGRPLEEATAVERIDAILVLAGGVNERGEPLETVKRRLRLAAELHGQALQSVFELHFQSSLPCLLATSQLPDSSGQ